MHYVLQNTSVNDAIFPRKQYKSKLNKNIKNKKRNTKTKKIKYYAKSNKLYLTLNNLIHYKNIFQHNRKIDTTIILLKKIEFDIFYSGKRKYPLLVKELITPLTGTTDPNEPPIDRRIIDDPFREDADIPTKYRHTLNDYEKLMAYGGSMGHNAPAGQHKTNMTIYSETFLLSNITPQEMVFNSGLWVIMENWCKQLGYNTNLKNITVFTGSIPDSKDVIINNYINTNINNTSTKNIKPTKMNIPLKMFKIICFQKAGKPNVTYMEILIANNAPYYIEPKIGKFDLNTYLIATNSYNWFQNFSGINIDKLLKYYNFNTLNIKPFRYFINMSFNLSPSLKLLMKKSNWFGYLIYSNTIEELDNKWNECKLLEKEFQSIQFHKKYYEIVRNRLLDKISNNISNNMSNNMSNIFIKK